jgi:hypothetical protein
MNWKDKVKSLFTQAVDEIPENASVAVPFTPAPVQFTEADIKAREEEAAKKAREAAELEFADKMRKIEIEQQVKGHQEAVKTKTQELTSSGKIIPAWIKGGLVQFLEALPWQQEASIEFSEGKQQTPYDYFIGFLEGLPKLVNLSEFAGKDRDISTGGAGEKLSALIQKRMTERSIPYGQAFSEVQMENPDLALEYAQSFGR